VLQCGVVCCRVLQRSAVRCSVLQVVQAPQILSVMTLGMCYSVVQCAPVWCSVLQFGAVCCSVLQCVAGSSDFVRRGSLIVLQQVVVCFSCSFMRAPQILLVVTLLVYAQTNIHTHTHTHSHTHTNTQTHTSTRTHTHRPTSETYTHFIPLSHTHCNTHYNIHLNTLPHAATHCNTHCKHWNALSLSHTHLRALSLSQFRSVCLSVTHTHTHTFKYTHTLSHKCVYAWRYRVATIIRLLKIIGLFCKRAL